MKLKELFEAQEDVKVYFKYQLYDQLGPHSASRSISTKGADVLAAAGLEFTGKLEDLEHVAFESKFKSVLSQIKKQAGNGVSIHGEAMDLGFGFTKEMAAAHFKAAKAKSQKEYTDHA